MDKRPQKSDFDPFLPKRPYFCTIQTKKTDIETNLLQISALAEARLEENERFSDFLKNRDSLALDEIVQFLNREVTKQVDCTGCGNCCKSLMIVVSEQEADHLSDVLQQKRNAFDQQYLEKGANGLMLMNAIPCAFLSENKCSVYEHRFEGCKEFPALNLPNFKKRLFTHFMHYGRCPILFNVLERLKEVLNFEKNQVKTTVI